MTFEQPRSTFASQEVGHSVSSEGTCDDLGVDFDVNLKVMCWNVCGWSNLDGGQFGRGVDHTDIY